MNKAEIIQQALWLIHDIMCEINLTKANSWDLVYRKETAESIQKRTDWERKYHHIMTGEEYIYIVDLDTGDLLYAVNVTGDNVLTALSELMDLLSRKF